MKRVVAILALLLLGACTLAQVVNVVVPDTGYRWVKDIAYGDDPAQKLDIYVPDKTPDCTVLFYPGGGWTSVARDLYKFVGQGFASRGCVAVVAAYRTYPAAHYADIMADTAKAFVWTHQHIAEYGGDPAHIFLAGHSAGAFNAVMLAVHPRFLKEASGARGWIAGVIGIAGPYDFKPSEEKDAVRDVFAGVDDKTAMPVAYVVPGLPPMFLAAGDKDERVQPRNTHSMAARLRATHNTVEEKIYPGQAHTGILLALYSGNRGRTPLLDDVMAFIRRQQ